MNCCVNNNRSNGGRSSGRGQVQRPTTLSSLGSRTWADIPTDVLPLVYHFYANYPIDVIRLSHLNNEMFRLASDNSLGTKESSNENNSNKQRKQKNNVQLCFQYCTDFLSETSHVKWAHIKRQVRNKKHFFEELDAYLNKRSKKWEYIKLKERMDTNKQKNAASMFTIFLMFALSVLAILMRTCGWISNNTMFVPIYGFLVSLVNARTIIAERLGCSFTLLNIILIADTICIHKKLENESFPLHWTLILLPTISAYYCLCTMIHFGNGLHLCLFLLQTFSIGLYLDGFIPFNLSTILTPFFLLDIYYFVQILKSEAFRKLSGWRDLLLLGSLVWMKILWCHSIYNYCSWLPFVFIILIKIA
jgi:hypothetical protein